jgi:hypothetical protein
LLDASSFLVAKTHGVLRVGVALFGGKAEPFQRLGVVPRHAFAIPVKAAQIALRGAVALQGGGAEPLCGAREIAFVARALVSKGLTLMGKGVSAVERQGWENKMAAIRTFDEINRRYGGQEESSATRKWVAEAIRAKEELEPRVCCSGK